MRTLFIQQPGEEIREIEDFPGYWASNLGRIISAFHVKWLVLCPSFNGWGYQKVTLHCDGKQYTRQVHDLVGRAFNDFSGPGTEWRHFPDSTRTNNRADNLVWGTHLENNWDMIKDNGRQDEWGIYHSKSKKKPFRLQISLRDGVKYFGLFSTKGEARLERDSLCEIHGIRGRT